MYYFFVLCFILWCAIKHFLSYSIKNPYGYKTGWSLRELVYEAEMDWTLSPEALKFAEEVLGEVQELRDKNIEELRCMIIDRAECHPPRTDDGFLLRFLRVKKFDKERAYRLLVRYCKFREDCRRLWQGVRWQLLRRLGHVISGVLYDRPDVGRIIICRIGQWDPEKLSLEDLMSGALIMMELGALLPKIQILGGSCIIDCQGLMIRRMRHFTPAMATHGVNLLGVAFPTRVHHIHVINISKIMEYAFAFFRNFFPSYVWSRVHFHGTDLTTLHRFIDPQCLPTRLGGCQEEVPIDYWIHKVLQYKNKDFDKEMLSLGYSLDQLS